jgi:hypothetical protein
VASSTETLSVTAAAVVSAVVFTVDHVLTLSRAWHLTQTTL